MTAVTRDFVETLEITTRAANVVLNGYMDLPVERLLADVADGAPFLKLPRAGKKTLNELREVLLGMSAIEPPPAPKREYTPQFLRGDFAISDDGRLYTATRIDLKRDREIARLRAGGVSAEEVAARFEITVARVSQIVRKMQRLEPQLVAAKRVVDAGVVADGRAA